MLRLRTLGGLSLERDGEPYIGAATPQRRALALLALLAAGSAGGAHGVSRERLLVLLWPESTEEQARNALRQALFRLRHDLGEPDMISGTIELRLNDAVIASDVAEFDAALIRGDLERAVQLYAGPFLESFNLPKAAEFERWAADERARRAHQVAAALEALAAGATARGDNAVAVACWRRLAALDPTNSRVALGLMTALADSGDRAGALQYARLHEILLREEFDIAPEDTVVELTSRLRAQSFTDQAVTVGRASRSEVLNEAPIVTADTEASESLPPTANGAAPISSPAAPSREVRAPGRRALWLYVPLAVALLVGSIFLWGWPRGGRRRSVASGTLASRPRLVPGGVSLGSFGFESSCLVANGDILCWGRNDDGQLGDGSTRSAGSPVPVTAPTGAGHLRFTAVSGNSIHVCGLTATGAAYCWGQNGVGQLGDSTTAGSATPVLVSGGLAFTHISVGAFHTCGLVSGGSAYCWGWNNYGQLGTPSVTGTSSVPVQVAGSQRFTFITSNYLHTCALTPAGFAYCWGSNVEGQLGTGGERIGATPTLVTDKQKFVLLVTGGNHTCGIGESALTFCWGYNAFGQLGMFTTAMCGREPYQVTCSPRPQPLKTELRFVTLAAGQFHTCGLTAAGEAYCWGYNDAGQLGDGSTSGSYVPLLVSGGLRFTRLSGGAHHSCALARDARVFCWGGNQHGQLGDGTHADSRWPVEVRVRGGQ